MYTLTIPKTARLAYCHRRFRDFRKKLYDICKISVLLQAAALDSAACRLRLKSQGYSFLMAENSLHEKLTWLILILADRPACLSCHQKKGWHNGRNTTNLYSSFSGIPFQISAHGKIPETVPESAVRSTGKVPLSQRLARALVRGA